MRKKILITGGCGFIGSHLAKFLDLAGHSVIIVDDLSTGFQRNLDGCSKQVKVIISRVEDFDFGTVGNLDGVFHLAAQASVPYSIDHFYDSSATNLRTTIKVVDYCSRFKVPLVYASSSAVYGNLPLGDEKAEVDILSPYAADKLAAEIYSAMAHKLYSLRSYGLRFFNVYGPRQDPKNPYSGVISIFIDRLLNGFPITINGGYQTRDFIYVNDIVEGLYRSYQYLQKNDVATCSNLLTGHSISIDELAKELASILCVRPEINYRELSAGDPAVSLGTTARMIHNLKLGPLTPLTTGLKETVDWMREQNAQS